MPRTESETGDVELGATEVSLEGLTSTEAEARLKQYGPNEIPEKQTSTFEMLLKQFTGPMPFMIEVAAVLAGAVEDWEDFAIILCLLIVNATIGFFEESKAQGEVNALRASLKTKAAVKRDGEFVMLESAKIVPGDIFLLKGGMVVPADCEMVEGEEIVVDTSALTGESTPRKVPDRNDNRSLLSGFIVKSGECLGCATKTGLNTEMGEAAALVHAASDRDTQGVFEHKIMNITEVVILITLVVTAIIVFVQIYVRDDDFDTVILMALSLVIASVPVALPMVMQITMAIGARKMADHKAIVTHLTALQEIASMTVLCSDKTGTLTTANITVMPDQIWILPESGYTKDECLILSAIASNKASLDDAIDSAVFRAMAKRFGESWQDRIEEYHVNKFIGFNPEYKRTVAYADRHSSDPKNKSPPVKLRIGKGLVDKVLSTSQDGGDCWEVENYDKVRDMVKNIDTEMSLKGYKTIAVALSENDGPMKFIGIIPMLDPPREDTEWVIQKMHDSGIEVKMITGDHLNIAKETARLIGLSTNILPNSELWPASAMRDEMIEMAGGFAQVMPKDKQEVVAVLQNKGLVVGMTGDGVNDAPALKQAQIGIAVQGATDAARGASDIILTEPGLTPIYTAVVESRRIYQRLRSYVLYRLSATVQIVTLLSILIFVFDQAISAIYIILLALLNDITMIMVAYDNVKPSKHPEKPTVSSLLTLSVFLGLWMTFFSVMFFILSYEIMSDSYSDYGGYRETVIYMQISLSIEMLIFNCREPEDWLWTSAPCLGLSLSVFFANVLVIVFGATGVIMSMLELKDIAIIVAYDICLLFVLDALKVGYQSWLKTSGFGAYLDTAGSDYGNEKGSFLWNRIMDVRRFIICSKEVPNDDAHDHTSAGRERRRLREQEQQRNGGLPDSFFSPSGDDDDDASNPLLGAASLLSSYLPS
jgi:H+-transporting ATPase